jgi:predicted metal-dependent phosphoesterase TrpH
MGKADLHIHTVYSWDGTCTVEAVLKQAAHAAQLDVIAITDHDEIRGALEAQELAPRYGIEVIAGSEISTADGHLLALFIHENIPAGLSLKETVWRIHGQGGMCIVPHPEARGTPSVNRRVIGEALQDGTVARTLRGIETFNAGLFDHRANSNAETIALELGLAQVGSSDSHLIWTIGDGVALFPGRSADDFRQALYAGETIPEVVRQPAPAIILASWLQGHLLRRAGWVEYNRFPEAPVRLERVSRLPRFALADE